MAGASPATTMIRLDRPMHPSHGSGTPLRVPHRHQPKFPSSVILSEAKDLVLISQGHPPCQSSLTTRQAGWVDAIKAIFFARNQPLICFSRARAACTSDVSSKYTKCVIWYVLVKAATRCFLCSYM